MPCNVAIRYKYAQSMSFWSNALICSALSGFIQVRAQQMSSSASGRMFDVKPLLGIGRGLKG